MTLVQCFTLLLLLLLPQVALSQEIEPIEQELDSCLSIESNMTTAGMTRCTNIAKEQWDIELNKYYNLLMNVLDEDGKTILRSSQRKWIEYSNKEYFFIDKFYLEVKQGTMWIPIAAAKKKEIIQNRAIELRKYYNMLEY